MIGKCKDCKFWGVSYDGVCDREGDLHTTKDPLRSFEVRASAADDTDLRAWLVTAPDFGCIQFVKVEK